jgi:hypothetical protein
MLLATSKKLANGKQRSARTPGRAAKPARADSKTSSAALSGRFLPGASWVRWRHWLTIAIRATSCSTRAISLE